MGGQAVVTPVQSNAGQIATEEQYITQLITLMNQQKDEAKAEVKATQAEAKNDEELMLRQARADAEKAERTRRMAKGKRDLLYYTAAGVDTKRKSMTLLGGI